MKNILTATIMAAFLMIAGRLEAWSSTYLMSGRVLQTVGTVTLIMDADGEIWEVENNPLPDNSKVKIVFHDNLTPHYIYDDVIVDIKLEVP